MSERYLVLTGAYNNAGDYLIASRAIALLRRFRPDRTVAEYTRKVISDREFKDAASTARAVLIAGGPAFRKDLVPGVVPEGINDILDMGVPVILFGVGWKHYSGTWQDAHRYGLNESTLQLLRVSAQHGYSHSCRDLHSRYIARRHGFDNVHVTGCPALFRETGVPASPVIPELVQRIVFSPGVSYLRESGGMTQLLYLARELRTRHPEATITAAFHHSLDRETLRSAYGATSIHVRRYARTRQLLRLLKSIGVEISDISGNLDAMRALYDSADAHIGYRVHGHVYMTSGGKPSVLLAEDNRALGFKDLIGGSIFDAIPKRAYGDGLRARLKQAAARRILKLDSIHDPTAVLEFALDALQDELCGDSSSVELSLSVLRTLEKRMERYLQTLP